MLQSLFVCRRLLTDGTVIPVSLIAVVSTVLEKSVFCGYLAVASVSLGLPTQFVHCCLAATRAFMPASLIVIPCTILEISKFLGQLPVDDDDEDDEKCQLNASIASLRSELKFKRAHLKLTVCGRKQVSKQANIHTHVRNAVPLVWGSLRLAPITLEFN